MNQLVTSLQERLGVGKQKLHKFLEAEGTQSHQTGIKITMKPKIVEIQLIHKEAFSEPPLSD